jgi:SAM-dependent methyltransferase
MTEDHGGEGATHPGAIYRSPLLYQMVMRALYGRSYRSRQSAIAELIEPDSTVVEACCGLGTLYLDHLRRKDVRYTGLDSSAKFVRMLAKKGIDVRSWDMHMAIPLPSADYVVMQASLYHFLPDPGPVVDRMLSAAKRQVIIAEPVRNLTTDHPRLGRVFATLTDAGSGPELHRFDAEALDRFFSRYADRVGHVGSIADGREKLYVLEAGGRAAGSS